MKYEELIDFTQKILRQIISRFIALSYPCEDLDHLIGDCPPYSGRKKIPPDFSTICLKN